MSWHLFQNSLLVSGSATLAATVLGLSVALLATALPKGGQAFLLATAIVAFSLPPFLVTNCWLHLLGAAGSWQSWAPWSIYSPGGAAWILALMLWPVPFFAAWSSWRQLRSAQLESDLLLSGSALFRWLLWPMARPLLGVAVGLTFVLAFNNFSVPAILQVKVFPAELWLRYSTQFDYKSVLWLSIPVIVAPAILLWLWPRRMVAWSAQSGVLSARLFRQQLGRTGLAVVAVLTAVALFFSLALPVGHLLGSSRTWSEVPTVFQAEPRLFFQSAWLAAAAALVCTLVGLWGHNRRWELALWLPLLAPGVLLGVALVFLLNRPVLDAVYRSLGVIICSWAVRYSGLAWNGLARVMRAVDADLVEDAKMNGARGWSLFRVAYLPQIAAPAAALWYMIYLLCLWDVETIVLTYPPGGETLALRIFNLLHYGHTAQVNALCLLLLAVALAPLVFWLGSRSLRLGFRPALPLLLLGLLTSCSQDQPQGRFFSGVEVIGSRGTRMGEFNKPRSLTVDKNDNLYVVDMTGRVQKFSPDGKFLLSWQMPETDLGKPKGMSCDVHGNILVLEPHYQRVNHFSPEGKLLAQWGSKGTNEGLLALPRSIVANRAGNIYISEYTTVDRVQCFSRDGSQFLLAFGRPGTDKGEFNRAEGLAIDASNRVYVADSCNHRIAIFSADGKFLRSYGTPGSNLGQLSYPYDIRVDAQGYQYVCEFGNSRIQIFDAQDKPVEVVGGIGSAPGQLNNPWAIALDSKGNLYVADANNHRVQKYLRARHGS